ncbi:MAG: MFS transporter [Propionibacteriaceae bacterium]|nr:MFS transporter [Propionibacteriaceae bacterium]
MENSQALPNPKTLDLQKFLDDHKFSGYQWGIYFMLLIILLFDGLAVYISGGLANDMRWQWGGLAMGSKLPPPGWDVTLMLSAVHLGAAIGALIAGPIADKIGRKNVVIVSAIVCFVFLALSGFANSPIQMLVMRVLTGLGLGASLANCVPLFSEFCPPKRRAFLTTLMYCGFPFGSAIGGFIIAPIAATGSSAWRMCFWVFGGIALVLTIIFMFIIPESVRYQIFSNKPADKIRATLSKIGTVPAEVTEFDSGERQVTEDEKKAGLKLVLSKQFLPGSVMLWLTYFCGLIVVYAMLSWLPTLANNPSMHMTPTQGTVLGALFNFGALAAIVIGALMVKYNGNIVLAIGYILGAVVVLVIGPSIGTVVLMMALVFLGGMFVNASQSALPALAAMFYPAQGRATGVSWMVGIGKFGGFIGTLAIGPMLKAGVGLNGIFIMLGIIAMVSFVALLVKNAIYRNKGTASAPAAEPVLETA